MEEPKKTKLDSLNSPNASDLIVSSTEPTTVRTERPINQSARNSDEAINLDLQPKPSRAVILWMLLIAVVLTVLGYEMHGDLRPANNVVVNMDGDDASDCEIVVDGEAHGKFDSKDKGGRPSNNAWLNLSNGKHHIDIKKAGQIIQSRDFEVKGKEYLRFDSGSTSKSN